MTTKSTDLTIPDNARLIAAYDQPAKIDGILDAIEKEAKAFVPDLSTAKSRKEITSLAFKVTRSKTAFDDIGKQLNADKRESIGIVDLERRKIRDRLDALAAEVKRPLVEWQGKEDSRIAGHMSALEQFDISNMNAGMSASAISARLDNIEAVEIGDTWEEFKVIAKANGMAAIVTLKSFLATATEREANEKELAELRAEKAERERVDAEKAEAERIEAERIRFDKAEKERKAHQVAAQKAAADKARKDAETKAKADADAAAEKHKREMAEAKEREEQAAQRERDNIEKELRDKEAAETKRADNTRIRNRVKKKIAAELSKIIRASSEAEHVAGLLIDNRIPHVKVTF